MVGIRQTWWSILRHPKGDEFGQETVRLPALSIRLKSWYSIALMQENNETIIDSRIYEVSFIFDNKLDEGAALEKGNAIKQSIATLGGSFISEEAPYMRELAYEMIRVQNNVNVRFNEGYFGWIKFEAPSTGVKSLEKTLKDDEQVVRFLVVKTVSENTVYTKRAPVIKAETIADIPGVGTAEISESIVVDNAVTEDVNIDTTSGVEIPAISETAEAIPEVPAVAEETK